MAVLEMEPMEVDTEETTDPTEWTWKPKVKDYKRLADTTKATRNTSQKTGSAQTDHGEGY